MGVSVHTVAGADRSRRVRDDRPGGFSGRTQPQPLTGHEPVDGPAPGLLRIAPGLAHQVANAVRFVGLDEEHLGAAVLELFGLVTQLRDEGWFRSERLVVELEND